MYTERNLLTIRRKKKVKKTPKSYFRKQMISLNENLASLPVCSVEFRLYYVGTAITKILVK